MKLKTLTLRNFKGIKSRIFAFDQNDDTVIIGENEAGKTTIADAATWLLTGKAYTGETDFSPKTRQGDREVHRLEHEVSATYVDEAGNQIELTRTLKERWVNKRGATIEAYEGDTTEYKIDAVPVTAGEYQERIAGVFGTPDQILLLTQPTYFSEALPWKNRRDLILAMSGDISDEEVIASDKQLSDLGTYLDKGGGAKYTIDEALKIAQARRSKIDEELKLIPTRIDEASRSMPDLNTEKLGEYQTQLKRAEEKLAGVRIKLDEAKQMTIAQTTTVELAHLRAQLAEAEANHRRAEAELTSASEEPVRAAKATCEDVGRRLKQAEAEATELQIDLDQLEKKRLAIMADWKAERSKAWTGDTVCGACGQNLPSDQVEEAIARFNQQRSERLQAIEDKGKQTASSEMISQCKARLEATKEAITGLEAERDTAKTAYQKAQATMRKPVAFYDTPEFTDLTARIKQLESDANAAIRQASDQQMEHIARLQQAEIEALTMIDISRREVADCERAKELQQRIDQLTDREAELVRQYEEEQRKAFLCEAFIRRKADLLTERINGQFDTLRVKLFDDLKNGGLQPTCEILVPNETGTIVPYKSANNAGRIKAGLEVIARLSQHFGRTIPVIIDNAESTNNLTGTDTMQLIRLEVAPQGVPLSSMTAKRYQELTEAARFELVERLALIDRDEETKKAG